MSKNDSGKGPARRSVPWDWPRPEKAAEAAKDKATEEVAEDATVAVDESEAGGSRRIGAKSVGNDSTIPLDDIKDDPEFRSLIPRLSETELEGLVKSLCEAGGCLSPIVVWTCDGVKIVVDGHNRLKICKKYQLSYSIREMEFPDREAVKEWIVQHQLSRRNLRPQATTYFRGKRYNSADKRQGQRPDSTKGQNDQKSTAKQMEGEFGVAERTIRRSAEVANALDTLAENCGDEIRQRYLSEDVKLTDVQLKNLAKLVPSEQRARIPKVIKAGGVEKPESVKRTPTEKFVGGWKKVKEEDRRNVLLGLLSDQDFAALLVEVQTEHGSPTEEGDSEDAGTDADDAEE
jgi:hypothetical protein